MGGARLSGRMPPLRGFEVDFSPTSRPKLARSDKNEDSFQEKLDAILDKIKAQGYESLSQEEKDFLYEASQK